MRIEDTICDYCAKGGGRKKPSWRASDMPGVKTCNFCLRTQEFKHVADLSGGNKWIKMGRDAAGQPTAYCKRCGKVAYSNKAEALKWAFKFGQNAYFDPKCELDHLSKQPFRI